MKGRRRPNDVVVKGDIVDNVRYLVELLGWTKAVDMSMMQEKQYRESHNEDSKTQVPTTYVDQNQNDMNTKNLSSAATVHSKDLSQ